MKGFVNGLEGGNLAAHICNYVGETVTIFTSSGGQSGSGFTGVVLAVNDCFVRLLTRIGPAPGCALGNACSDFYVGNGGHGGKHGGYDNAGMGNYGPVLPGNYPSVVDAGGWNGYPVATVGSVTDIPISAIVSFVHNAV